MSKPKHIEFDDGTKAIIFDNATKILRNHNFNQDFLHYYTSGLFDLMKIPNSNKLMLIEKGTV